jgi:hypothetical protein
MHPTWLRAGLQRPGAHYLGTGNRAAELTQQANDLQQLEPMLAATAATLAAAGVPERPGRLLADVGYWTIANLTRIPDAPELLIPRQARPPGQALCLHSRATRGNPDVRITLV